MRTYLVTHTTVVLDIQDRTPEEREREAQAAVQACLDSLCPDKYMTFAINYDERGGRSLETDIKPEHLSQAIKKYARDVKYHRIAILGTGFLKPGSPLERTNEGKSREW